jgi:hypothetical protein
MFDMSFEALMDLIYLSSIVYSLIPLGFGIFLLNIIRIIASNKEMRIPALQALNNLLTDKIWFLISAFTIGCYLLLVPSTFIGLLTSLNLNDYFYAYVITFGILGVLNLLLEKDNLRLALKNLKRKKIILNLRLSTSSLIMLTFLVAVSFRFLQLLSLYLASPLIWQWDAVSLYLPIAKSILLSGALKENVIFYSGGTAVNGYPPLVPLFYAFVMRFYYDAFRFVPVVMQIFILLTIYGLASKLLNNKLSGILAVTFFIFSSILDFVWAHDLLYLDTAFISFLLISTFYVISFLESDNGSREFINLVFYCLSSGLLLMSKDIALPFILPGLGFYFWKKLNHKSGKVGILISLLCSILVPFFLTAYDAKFDNRAYLLIPLFTCTLLTLIGAQKSKQVREPTSILRLLIEILIVCLIFFAPSTIYLLYNVFIRHLNFYPSVTHFGITEWVAILGPLSGPAESPIITLYNRAANPFLHRFIFPFLLVSLVSMSLYYYERESRDKSSYIILLLMLAYWLIGYLFFFRVQAENTKRLFYLIPFLTIMTGYVPCLQQTSAQKVHNNVVLFIFILLAYPILYYLYTLYFIARSIIGLDVFWQLFTNNAFLSIQEITLFTIIQSIIILGVFYLRMRRSSKKCLERRLIRSIGSRLIIIALVLLVLIGSLSPLSQTIQRIYLKGLVPLYSNNLPENALKHSGEMHPYVEVLNYLKSSGISSKNTVILTFGFFPLAFFTELKVYVVGIYGPWSEGGLFLLRHFVDKRDNVTIINTLRHYNITYFLIPTKANPWGWKFYEQVRKHTPLLVYVENQQYLSDGNGNTIKFTLIKEFYWYKLYQVRIVN